MNRHPLVRLGFFGCVGAVLLFAAIAGGTAGEQDAPLIAGSAASVLAILALAAVGAGLTFRLRPVAAAMCLVAASAALSWIVLDRLAAGIVFAATPIAPLVLIAIAAIACAGLSLWARNNDWLAGLAVPALFAVLVLVLWEAVVVGYGIPGILLPSPSAIGRAVLAYSYDLTQDFWQTVVREAIPGFLIGSAAGIVIALAVDRSPFLQAGLLPVGNWVGVMPIVGIAPVMVMWFGFGWESKAGVVVLMTFFPTLITTRAGLRAATPLETDLMELYSSSYGQTLWKLRIPAAMPFVLSALKLNASFALIGSIVAEYFGTPTYGLGFRISTEVGRLNLDRVWAAIAIAALTGAAAYGALSLAERTLTFWHPSALRRGKP